MSPYHNDLSKMSPYHNDFLGSARSMSVCLLASSLMSGYDNSFLPLGPDAEVVVSTLAARHMKNLLKCNFKRYSLVVRAFVLFH